MFLEACEKVSSASVTPESKLEGIERLISAENVVEAVFHDFFH